jgi:peptide/nickel transport system ATP-binding protein
LNQDICLEVKNLSVRIQDRDAVLCPVNNISFRLSKGSILGLVGESGAGKSLTAKAVAGLLNPRNTECQGQIIFEGREISGLSDNELRKLRGPAISMIFQDPSAALNPVMTIGRQLREIYTTHLGCSEKAAKASGLEMLRKVRLSEPEKIWHEYSYQLSGGMRQRAMIAMALALGPSLIIADEPTTALDVTTQAQILYELKLLQQQTGVAILLISHDMGVIAEMADAVAVMRAGEIVEYNECLSLFDSPQHPYTRELLQSSLMI